MAEPLSPRRRARTKRAPLASEASSPPLQAADGSADVQVANATSAQDLVSLPPPAGVGSAEPGANAVFQRSPWRGVSLGGWLLLEPGPSRELFSNHRAPAAAAPASGTSATAAPASPASAVRGLEVGQEALCEWELMQILRARNELDALRQHRETFVTRADLEEIKRLGLNAVRIPFGYWVVLGPLSPQEPYVGPALEYLDRAVSWCEELGLQVLLDLHGAPGGESAETPCGRRQRPLGRWTWRQWRFKESLVALRVIAERYASSPCVTGIAVCNEPAPSVPLTTLCRFYGQALETVRGAGMGSQVTVVLPVFQRSMAEFAVRWGAVQRRAERLKIDHGDVCFEVHWYHCFENEWHGRTFAQHLRALQEHAKELRTYPIVVGEWSLALGRGAQPGLLKHGEMRRTFAHAQLAAYREASHGWFFWTWSDLGGGADWDWQQSQREGIWPAQLELPAGLNAGLLREPPTSEAAGNAQHDPDPLERVLDLPASDPFIRFGDTVYLRAFNGSYLDVEGDRVRARYGDRGRWQQFVLCPASRPKRGEGASAAAAARILRDGDAVCLLAHTGRFLGVSEETATAAAHWSETEQNVACCIFHLRVEEGKSPKVRHRSTVFLQSHATSKVLAPNESEPQQRDEVVAKWEDFSEWQRLVIEKPLTTAVNPHRPRRRSLARLPRPAGLPTRVPKLRRSLSVDTGLKAVKEAATPLRRSLGGEIPPPPSVTPGSARRLSRATSLGGGGGEQAPGSPAPRRSSLASGSNSAGALIRRHSMDGRVGAGACWEDEQVAEVSATPARKRRSMAAAASNASPKAALPGAARRRSSMNGCGATVEASALNDENAEGSEPSSPPLKAWRTGPDFGSTCPATTPHRRRRSDANELELEELASLTTPSRRRRISAGPEDLLQFLIEPSPMAAVPVLPTFMKQSSMSQASPATARPAMVPTSLFG
eukprot:TRINITY_DN20199_c0_g2_i1.p1 TRINITY_DN20199_c0_g2~~TRINITY_DN20199_c0_g2_i1.p1  ORF type:complete len:970 (-),score=160.28 TRINITY_DN20199_c0_g2_i1:129-2957(-)